MGHDIVLDPVHLGPDATVVLRKGETLYRVLEDVEVNSEGGSIGLPGKDIRGVKGVMQSTTLRLIWLERGSSSTDTKRSCAMPLNVLSDVATCTLQAHLVWLMLHVSHHMQPLSVVRYMSNQKQAPRSKA
jgi:hypothetical protein